MKKPDWKVWLENKKECEFWLNNYLRKKILRKSEDESKLYLKKTDHNLNFANWILDKHNNIIKNELRNETFYDWCINIYYYAIYHSIQALISKEGYKSKNHSATLCFLIYHHYHLQNSINEEDVNLVASSLNKEDIEVIGDSKEMREKACYDVHEMFEKSLAENFREKTVNFINKIKVLLK
ncbi:MAG: HEPN domain-containing protein [archaeon]